MKTTAEHETGDLWVFGYGSLMWRPGFRYLERRSRPSDRAAPGALRLFLRASRHAGTAGPGARARSRRHVPRHRLSGRCRGRAETIEYLREREQVTSVYIETMRQIELEDDARRRVRALCYIVDRSHVQYAGRLTLDESLHLVRQGHGSSGANRDYVVETVRALEALGYREDELHLLAAHLQGGHEAGVSDE